ncbi:MAG: hypothetical protein U9Q21_03265 [Candidatus Auribacterota bacterium]|nr:hypothetical protein [Candidatus Auribacterota bacterium]
MRNMLENYPEREMRIREIGEEAGLDLSGGIMDDWSTCVLAADSELWDNDWEEMFHNYCQDIVL